MKTSTKLGVFTILIALASVGIANAQTFAQDCSAAATGNPYAPVACDSYYQATYAASQVTATSGANIINNLALLLAQYALPLIILAIVVAFLARVGVLDWLFKR